MSLLSVLSISPGLRIRRNLLAESLPVLATECRIVLRANPITLFRPKEVFIDQKKLFRARYNNNMAAIMNDHLKKSKNLDYHNKGPMNMALLCVSIFIGLVLLAYGAEKSVGLTIILEPIGLMSTIAPMPVTCATATIFRSN